MRELEQILHKRRPGQLVIATQTPPLAPILPLLPIADFTATPGVGVAAQVDGRRVEVRSGRALALAAPDAVRGHGYVLMTHAGADAVLTVLANPQAKLGLIFLDAKRAAEQISSLLSPVPSTVPAFPG